MVWNGRRFYRAEGMYQTGPFLMASFSGEDLGYADFCTASNIVILATSKNLQVQTSYSSR